MFFGLSNTPTNFQGYINKTLAKKLKVCVIEYLDNILNYNKILSQVHKKLFRSKASFKKNSFSTNR